MNAGGTPLKIAAFSVKIKPERDIFAKIVDPLRFFGRRERPRLPAISLRQLAFPGAEVYIRTIPSCSRIGMMSGKRHAFGVLLARFLFAAAITALPLYAMRGIFLNVETGVKVDFELRYGNRADNHWQIFYKTEDGPNWERLPSERMDAEAESTKIRALLPVKTLREIRLDFGSAPGDVVCRGFSVEGSERIAFGDMTKTFTDI